MIEAKIDSVDIIKTLKRYKTLLVLTVSVSLAIAIAYSIWGTRYYDSSSIFRTLEMENILIPNVNEEIANYNYIKLDPQKPERVNMYSLNLLKTNNFAWKTINKFNLIEYFEIVETDSLKIKDEALKQYKENLTNFIYDEESELVTIHVMSKDARLSYDIVNYQYELLDKYYKKEFYKHKDNLINFLSDQIAYVKNNKEKVDNEIKEYDEENNSYLLNTKLVVLLENYFTLYREKLANEIEMQIAKENYGMGMQLVDDLIKKDSLLTLQLNDFTSNEDNQAPFVNFQAIPQHLIIHNMLKTKQQLLTDLLSYLNIVYESARIDRLRHQEVVEIIDYPNIPGFHSRPKPVLIIVLAIIVSSILSSILVYNYDLFKRSNPK